MPNKSHGQSASQRLSAKYPDAVLAKGKGQDSPVPNQFRGETVTIQRDAQKGDAGYVEGTDQVLVIFEDGSTRIVKRSEVS